MTTTHATGPPRGACRPGWSPAWPAVSAGGTSTRLLRLLRHGRDLRATVVAAFDLAGTMVWRRKFPGHPYPPRVSESGTVWVCHRDVSGAVTVTELDSSGSVVRSVVPEHESHEHLGALVLLPEGFCNLWMPADRYHVIPPGRRHGWPP